MMEDLGPSLSSIFETSYENFEIIVVDDLSTDGTLKILGKIMKGDKKKLMKLIRNKVNLGPAASRNQEFL